MIPSFVNYISPISHGHQGKRLTDEEKLKSPIDQDSPNSIHGCWRISLATHSSENSFIMYGLHVIQDHESFHYGRVKDYSLLCAQGAGPTSSSASAANWCPGAPGRRWRRLKRGRLKILELSLHLKDVKPAMSLFLGLLLGSVCCALL